MKWQTIETAPEGEALFLSRIRNTRNNYVVGLGEHLRHRKLDNGESVYSHWMPLPAPPEDISVA